MFRHRDLLLRVAVDYRTAARLGRNGDRRTGTPDAPASGERIANVKLAYRGPAGAGESTHLQAIPQARLAGVVDALALAVSRR